MTLGSPSRERTLVLVTGTLSRWSPPLHAQYNDPDLWYPLPSTKDYSYHAMRSTSVLVASRAVSNMSHLPYGYDTTTTILRPRASHLITYLYPQHSVT